MIMTDKTKKNIIIFILLIIIAIMGYFLYNAYSKEPNTKEKTKKKETNIVQTPKDPVKESVDDVNNTNKYTKESSALGYIDAVEKQVMLNIVDSNAIEIKEGTYKIDSLTLLGVEFKGEKPTFGIVTINNKGAVSEAWLEFNETKVYYSLISGKAEVVDEFSNMNEITCIVENNNNVITNNCN